VNASVTRIPTHGHVPAPDGYVTAVRVAETVPGMSYRQLHYWTSLGYLESVQGTLGPGSGIQILYPETEVAVAYLMARLVADGVMPRVAARVARELSETGTATLAGITLHLPEPL